MGAAVAVVEELVPYVATEVLSSEFFLVSDLSRSLELEDDFTPLVTESPKGVFGWLFCTGSPPPGDFRLTL